MQMKVYTKPETLIDAENNLMVTKEEKVGGCGDGTVFPVPE